MSPHCSAIFLQHSRSADVIAAPGNTQAATGSAASMKARAETPTLINSFNPTSLSTTDSEMQHSVANVCSGGVCATVSKMLRSIKKTLGGKGFR
jgi:hypothetical protein